MIVCRNCGYSNEVGAEFCGSCGTFLEWSGEELSDAPATDAERAAAETATDEPGPSTPSPLPPVVPVATPSDGEPTTTCPVCGALVPHSRRFCPRCGTEIDHTTKPAVVGADEARGRSAVRLPAVAPRFIAAVAGILVVAVLALVALPRLVTPEVGSSVGSTAGTPTDDQSAASPSASAGGVDSTSPDPSGAAAASEVVPSVSAPAPSDEPPTGAAAEAAIATFLGDFDDAYRRGDVDFLIASLDPAVLAAYSEDACRSSIAGFSRPDFTTTIESVSGPGPWTYQAANGFSQAIPVAYTIEGSRTRAGDQSALSMHLGYAAGRFSWFASDC